MTFVRGLYVSGYRTPGRVDVGDAGVSSCQNYNYIILSNLHKNFKIIIKNIIYDSKHWLVCPTSPVLKKSSTIFI